MVVKKTKNILRKNKTIHNKKKTLNKKFKRSRKQFNNYSVLKGGSKKSAKTSRILTEQQVKTKKRKEQYESNSQAKTFRNKIYDEYKTHISNLGEVVKQIHTTHKNDKDQIYKEIKTVLKQNPHIQKQKKKEKENLKMIARYLTYDDTHKESNYATIEEMYQNFLPLKKSSNEEGIYGNILGKNANGKPMLFSSMSEIQTENRKTPQEVLLAKYMQRPENLHLLVPPPLPESSKLSPKELVKKQLESAEYFRKVAEKELANKTSQPSIKPSNPSQNIYGVIPNSKPLHSNSIVSTENLNDHTYRNLINSIIQQQQQQDKQYDTPRIPGTEKIALYDTPRSLGPEAQVSNKEEPVYENPLTLNPAYASQSIKQSVYENPVTLNPAYTKQSLRNKHVYEEEPESYGFTLKPSNSVDSVGYQIPISAAYQIPSPIDPAYQAPESSYGFGNTKNSYGYAVANTFPQNEIYAGFSSL